MKAGTLSSASFIIARPENTDVALAYIAYTFFWWETRGYPSYPAQARKLQKYWRMARLPIIPAAFRRLPGSLFRDTTLRSLAARSKFSVRHLYRRELPMSHRSSKPASTRLFIKLKLVGTITLPPHGGYWHWQTLVAFVYGNYAPAKNADHREGLSH